MHELPAERVVAEVSSQKSQWRLLSNRTFRALWIASIASNIGTWMHDVGAGWMMASISADPLMVALVQAATSLPMFLFVLPSGVLSDIIDRRRYLLFAQCWMLVSAAALGLLTFSGMVGPWLLLAATFLLGIGAAMAAPPFQSLLPELVGKEDLSTAVVLNALGVNISRAIGPALGGFILSLTSPALVFVLNAVSVLGVLLVVWRWHPAPREQHLPPEHFLPAVRVGLRYVKSAPLLRTVLLRAVGFFGFASAAWSLLPLIAKNQLGLGAAGYGALLGCIGLGAISGALLLPALRQRYSSDSLLTAASLLFAAVILCLARLDSVMLIGMVLMAAGLAWITAISILSVGAQASSAGWVKSRALAVYLVAFFGAMTAGSTLWGQLAKSINIPSALLAAGSAMVIVCLLMRRLRISDIHALDLSPARMHMSDAAAQLADIAHDRGPVMITVEYLVDPRDEQSFSEAIHAMRLVRQRGGALSWGVYRDTADTQRHLEVFVIESWLDHLRQHDHFSANDKAIHARALAFHKGATLPRVTHLISH